MAAPVARRLLPSFWSSWSWSVMTDGVALLEAVVAGGDVGLQVEVSVRCVDVAALERVIHRPGVGQKHMYDEAGKNNLI
jgi:hypothetical protein